MDNIALIGLIILVLWLVAIGYYLYVSRHQQDLVHDIEELREMLDTTEENPG